MPRPFRSITVAELIAVLQDVDDQESIVTFASDYGDYTHTQQIHSLRGEAETVLIHETGYSNSGWAVTREEDEDTDNADGDAPRVTVIR